MNSKNIVVAGHLCIDIIPDIPISTDKKAFFELLQPGHLIEVGSAVFSIGGAAANTGISMHLLGNSLSIVAMIGEDMLGMAALEMIGKYDTHLNDHILVNSETSSSYTIILDPPGIDRMFLHHPGANNQFTNDDLPIKLIAEADLFHFGYPQLMRQFIVGDGKYLADMYRLLKRSNCTTSLDVTFPDPSSKAGKTDWITIFEKTLPFVDIFCPSLEEILFMLLPDEFARMNENGDILEQVTPDLLIEISNELLNMGVKIVLIKLGDKGLYLHVCDQKKLKAFGKAAFETLSEWAAIRLWTSSYLVNVVGTTGAGDASIAGFLTSILHGMSPYEALNFAAGVGACNVEAFDSLGGIKGFDETYKRIKHGWKKNPLSLSSDGWELEPHYEIWYKV
ncbi:MAG: carbohydrate kinase family protein [Anaerolineaceae bacterium]|nr:carbohydrate kinase family protein [Anaerolineaceae bacterium]